MKQTVAVFIGGQSAEHDVSIITGLQVFNAIDRSVYSPFIVYISIEGRWYVGDTLEEKRNYIPDLNNKNIDEVTLDFEKKNHGLLISTTKKIIGASNQYLFDIALPAFHGTYGEDGNIQGVFEFLEIPYVGMRQLACSLFMNKQATKHYLTGLGIPVLSSAVIARPKDGFLIKREELVLLTKEVCFPCCVKPCHLGSSIGVAKANNIDELISVLPSIFKSDTAAIVEPFVENLVEYNISVSKSISNKIEVSAIEMPKNTKELLDFKEKYLSSSNGKLGEKLGDQDSEGMLSLTRDINPQINEELVRNIIDWAKKAFKAINGTGAPRIDFLCNSKTGEIWLNEVNSCPGSFAYFLWEAKTKSPTLFSELLNHLILEASTLQDSSGVVGDIVPSESRLFSRG